MFFIIFVEAMRKKNTKFEYQEQRDSNLLEVFNREFRKASCPCNLDEVYKRTVNSPCKRFWVSEEWATKVISSMIRGKPIDGFSKNKRDMYIEIYNRVEEIRLHNPELKLSTIVEEVVSSPAPCFYMTYGSAKVLLHKYRKKCREKRFR